MAVRMVKQHLVGLKNLLMNITAFKTCINEHDLPYRLAKSYNIEHRLTICIQTLIERFQEIDRNRTWSNILSRGFFSGSGGGGGGGYDAEGRCSISEGAMVL